MNEIEKLYKLAGVKPICKWWCKRFDKTLIADCNGIYNAEKECSKCKHGYIESRKYPPFTAEKQLELIKWLVTREEVLTIYYAHGFLYRCEVVRHSSACQENF